VFVTMVTGEMYRALNSRSETMVSFKKKITDNPWLFGAIAVSIGLTVIIVYWDAADILFDLRALAAIEWGIIAVACLPVIILEDIAKTVWNKSHAIQYVTRAEKA
jgi:hypothetical protein